MQGNTFCLPFQSDGEILSVIVSGAIHLTASGLRITCEEFLKFGHEFRRIAVYLKVAQV